jgi:hypothetical protein
VQALGDLHLVRKVKYSSPIFSIFEKTALCSYVRLCEVVNSVDNGGTDVARAILLLSVLRTRRRAVTLPSSGNVVQDLNVSKIKLS